MKKRDAFLLTAATWYIVGNFAIKGLNFLSVSVFTRIMSVDSYGLYNTYLVYESLMTALMSLGLNNTVKPAKYHFLSDFDSYLKSVTVYTFMSSMIFGLILVISYPFLGTTYFGFVVLVFVWICATGNCLSNIFIQKCIIENRYKLYILIEFMFNIPQIVLSVILIKNFPGLDSYDNRLIGHTIPMIFLLMICIIFLMKSGKFNINYKKYSVSMGLPMVVSSMSSTILTQSDRIIISIYCGSTKTGLYSGINYISSILYIFMLSIQNVWDQWFYKKINNNAVEEIRRKMKWYVLSFTGAVCCLMATGPEIVKVFLAPAYMESIYALIPLVLSWMFVFLYTLVSSIELVNRKSIYIAVGTGIGAAVNIILNLIFVPVYGYIAAAYTTLFSYGVILVYHLLVERKICRSGAYSLRLLIFSVVVSVGFGVLCNSALNMPIVRYGAIVILVVISIIYIFHDTRAYSSIFRT